jgi:hypothetical protein
MLFSLDLNLSETEDFTAIRIWFQYQFPSSLARHGKQASF